MKPKQPRPWRAARFAGCCAVSAALALSGCATAAQFRAGAQDMSAADVCSGWREGVERSDAELGALAWSEMMRRDLSAGQCDEILAQRAEQRGSALTIGLTAFVAAMAAGLAARGGGGQAPVPVAAPLTNGRDYAWDWDEFYGSNGLLMWACRGVTTGQFADPSHCAGLPRTDLRWPSKQYP